MAVQTPSYWKEAKYQPLIEVETVYGNKVKIPERFLNIWDIYSKTKEWVLPLLEQGKAAGFLDPQKEPRGKKQIDVRRVFFEVYQE